VAWGVHANAIGRDIPSDGSSAWRGEGDSRSTSGAWGGRHSPRRDCRNQSPQRSSAT